jgi:hypothetical protein
MNTKLLTAAALLAAAFAPSLASAEVRATANHAQQIAVDACQAYNAGSDLELDKVIKDGMGDFLVWLVDTDDNLTICNANGKGDIYANVTESADLLDGDGPAMLQTISTGTKPAKIVEGLCVAVADEQGDDVAVDATVKDGYGGYLVWLKVDAGGYIMCNGSAEGELFAFEDVDMPINGADDSEPATVQNPVRPQNPGHGPGQFG